MERQKPTTSIRHNDEFSQALIESYGRWMSGQGFGQHLYQEETYPELQKKGGEDDFSKKDPKANAGAPDPAVDLRTGAGIKQSHGAEIRDTTKVVARESCGEDMAHEKKEEKKEKKEKVKEAFNLYVEGVHYIFEKMDGVDDNGFKSCWKGYKKKGTKMKGGKEVNNCVKAGYEPIGELMLDEKAPPGAKYERMVKHIKKGYSKDGELTKKEKGIAYATAWKEKGKKEEYDVDTANQLWSEVAEKLEKLGEMDNTKFKVIGEKLDPVGKEDKDIDNDGDHDKSDKYLHARRKKISKIIGAKKKMKESLEIEEGKK